MAYQCGKHVSYEASYGGGGRDFTVKDWELYIGSVVSSNNWVAAVIFFAVSAQC
ncbi:hypothetical protein METHP14_60082 [Pseudomonas sp. P14-2025]